MATSIPRRSIASCRFWSPPGCCRSRWSAYSAGTHYERAFEARASRSPDLHPLRQEIVEFGVRGHRGPAARRRRELLASSSRPCPRALWACAPCRRRAEALRILTAGTAFAGIGSSDRSAGWLASEPVTQSEYATPVSRPRSAQNRLRTKPSIPAADGQDDHAPARDRCARSLNHDGPAAHGQRAGPGSGPAVRPRASPDGAQAPQARRVKRTVTAPRCTQTAALGAQRCTWATFLAKVTWWQAFSRHRCPPTTSVYANDSHCQLSLWPPRICPKFLGPAGPLRWSAGAGSGMCGHAGHHHCRQNGPSPEPPTPMTVRSAWSKSLVADDPVAPSGSPARAGCDRITVIRGIVAIR